MSRLRLSIQWVAIVAAAILGGCGGEKDPDGIAPNSPVALAEKSASAKSKLVGQQAPDFTLANQADQQVALKSLRGDWVVLYLYPKDDMPACACDATDYTRCILSFLNFKVAGAKFLAVTDLSVPNIAAFLRVHKATLDILSDRDHKVMAAYAAWAPAGIRSTVIIDPQGVIRYHWPVVTPAGHAVRVAQRLAELKSATPAK